MPALIRVVLARLRLERGVFFWCFRSTTPQRAAERAFGLAQLATCRDRALARRGYGAAGPARLGVQGTALPQTVCPSTACCVRCPNFRAHAGSEEAGIRRSICAEAQGARDARPLASEAAWFPLHPLVPTKQCAHCRRRFKRSTTSSGRAGQCWTSAAARAPGCRRGPGGWLRPLPPPLISAALLSHLPQHTRRARLRRPPPPQIACQALGPPANGGAILGIDLQARLRPSSLSLPFAGLPCLLLSCPLPAAPDPPASPPPAQAISLPIRHTDARVRALQADARALPASALLAAHPRGFSCVLSDMAPSTAGAGGVDAARSLALAERAVDIAIGAPPRPPRTRGSAAAGASKTVY